MNWLLKNLQRRTRYALQNPRYAFRSLYRELISADERFLASIASTGVAVRQMREFLDEPFRSEAFAACLQQAQLSFHGLFESADLYAKKVLNQYAVVRAFRPDVVVETGVANGVSSAYLLLALHLNDRGTLYSVGLNDPEYFQRANRSVGWLPNGYVPAGNSSLATLRKCCQNFSPSLTRSISSFTTVFILMTI